MEHFDLAAFYGGSATELYRTLGAHRTPDGWVFRVWAPHAVRVSVAYGRRQSRAFRRMIPISSPSPRRAAR